MKEKSLEVDELSLVMDHSSELSSRYYGGGTPPTARGKRKQNIVSTQDLLAPPSHFL
jgi:hypothetical protein